MIKIIKVYKDSRILENGTLDTLGLAIKNDNNYDILRFQFVDEFIDGTASLLTTLEDANHDKVAFPLTKNIEENSYDLVITKEIASTNELEFQMLITYQTDVVWHSRIAKLQILNALDVGSGEMPTTIENWLENANLVMSGYADQMIEWEQEVEQAVSSAENVNIEVEEGENLYNVTITDRNGNEYQAVIYQGANAVISGATASVDQTIGTPNVNVTMGGTESDRTFDFAFHNLKGEKGEQGEKGEPGAIKMQIVDSLPSTGSADTIYLVPITPDVQGNNYAEYVYINGAWEQLGKIGVQVDLTDYVKNTDYATSNVGGVIKIDTYYNLELSNGALRTQTITYSNYGNKSNYSFISKGTLENVITGKQLINQTTLDTSQATQDTKITNLENQVFGDETIEGEGTSLTLDGTLKGQFNSIDLKGNTSQTGTPTPTSPIPVNVVSGDNEIEICGKNWFDKSIANLTVGYIDTSGDFHTGGTSSATQGYIPIKPNTNMTISGTSFNVLVFYDKNKNFVERIVQSTSSYTFNKNAYYIRVQGATDSISVNSIMLNIGETALPYEPYIGNTYNIDLPVDNMLDTQYFQQGSINTSGVDVSANTNARGSNYIPVQPNTSYTISANTQLYDLRLSEYTSDKTHIKRNSKNNTTSLTITTSSTTYFVRWSLNYNNSTPTTQAIIDSLNLQLEKGSKPNSYTPFGTTPIEMCSSPDGTLRDYFLHDKTTDYWYKYWVIGKAVLNGTENDISGWSSFTNKLGIKISDVLNLINISSSATDNVLISNYFEKATSQNILYGNDIEGIATTGGNIYIKIDKTTASTSTEFKTWLSSHNTDVYYVLATPTTTQITYQPLIEQLNALELAQSKENQTNISQVNNDLPFIINVSAFLNNINGKIALLNKLTEV